MATVIENGGGGTSGGGSIVDITAPTLSVVNNTEETLPIGGKSGKCWLYYSTDKSISFHFTAAGEIDILTNKGFGTAFDDAGTMNVYQDGTAIKVQNKTGGDITIKYWPEMTA